MGEPVVLDTAVLTSALADSFGPSARILDLVLAGELVAAYDDRILIEWKQVLRHEEFGFSLRDVETVLAFIEGEGLRTSASVLVHSSTDTTSVHFLEVAKAAEAVLVVEDRDRRSSAAVVGVKVADPATFLEGLAHS